LVRCNPQHAGAHHHRGMGAPARATLFGPRPASRPRALDPFYGDAHLSRAMVFVQKNDIRGAGRPEPRMRLQPPDPMSYLTRGMLRSRARGFQQAPRLNER
jgi:hypothetical protein